MCEKDDRIKQLEGELSLEKLITENCEETIKELKSDNQSLKEALDDIASYVAKISRMLHALNLMDKYLR